MSPLSEFPYLANDIMSIYGVVRSINKLIGWEEYLAQSRNSVNVTILLLCKYMAQNGCWINGSSLYFWKWSLSVYFIIFINLLSWFWSSKPHNFLEEERPPHGDASFFILPTGLQLPVSLACDIINTSMQAERMPSPVAPQSSFPQMYHVHYPSGYVAT